jgi:hypothetical protein
MQFFTFFRRKGLRPSWEFSAQGVLWRLHPAPGSTFIGEERDPASHSAALFCLDGMTGKLRWRGDMRDEGWWTGISGIFRGVLLLHGFATPELPEEKKIIALEMATGKELWRNDEFTFLGVRDGAVIASRRVPGGAVVARLSLRGGVPEELASQNAERQFQRGAEEDERADTDAKYPAVLHAEDARRFPGLAGIVPAAADPVEFLALEAAVVVGYAVPDEGSSPASPLFTRSVAVVDRGTGRVLYRATLDRSLPFVPQGSFMARGEVLYCIREKKTITAIALRAPRKPSSPTSSASR